MIHDFRPAPLALAACGGFCSPLPWLRARRLDESPVAVDNFAFAPTTLTVKAGYDGGLRQS